MKRATPPPDFRLDHDLLVAIEEIRLQHRLFAHRARDRAERMLYYFGLGRRTRSPRANATIVGPQRDPANTTPPFRRFAASPLSDLALLPVKHTESLAAVLGRLAEKLDTGWDARDGDWRSDEEAFRRRRAEASARASENGWKWRNKNWHAAMRDLIDLWHFQGELDAWRKVVETTTPRDGEVEWRSARKAVHEFLDREGNTPTHRWVRERFGVGSLPWRAVLLGRNLPGWLQKNLALVLALALTTFVLSKVEAVSSLVLNLGPVALGPFAMALLPLLAARLRGWFQRELGGEIAVSEVGIQPLRSWVHLARSPDRWTEQWPPMAAESGTGHLRGKAVRTTLQSALRDFARAFSEPPSLMHVVVNARLRVLGYYALVWVAGAWKFSDWVADGIYSVYFTLFLIALILYAVILTARTLDLADFLAEQRVRLRSLVVLAVGFVALLLGRGFGFFAFVSAAYAVVLGVSFFRRPGRPLRLVAGLAWLVVACLFLVIGRNRDHGVWVAPESPAVDWRAELAPAWPFPGDGPVVVVAASGGGSRAALFAAMTLERLDEVAGTCPDGACSPAEHLHAISSVSGGSLATAGYVVRRLAGRKIEEPLVRAVGGDFLFPTLKGAFHPLRGRGELIEASWRGLDTPQDPAASPATDCAAAAPTWGDSGVALGDARLSDLARIWSCAAAEAAAAESGSAPPFPIPLFNSTTLEGHNLVISPLARDHYETGPLAEEVRDEARNRYAEPSADSSPTWVYYRDAAYGLEDLLGGAFDPPLSSAVRASANFPFGFPLVEIDTERRQFLHPLWATHRGLRRVRVTDGGVLSNSGMWSLFRLLLNHREELTRRGVLLVIVDAGKMPEIGPQEQILLGLRAAIGSQEPIAQHLHRAMIERLAAVLGDSLAVQHIGLTPRAADNVHTTWTLDGRTQERLRGIFDQQWNRELGSFESRWQHLTARWQARAAGDLPPPPQQQLIDRDRYPLD